MAINSEIYVDKTALISITNKVLGTMQKFACISRSRRFGKSMAAYMLAAYYGKDCDSSKQFAPYKIAKCDSYGKYLNKYKEAFVFIIDEWDCMLRDKSYHADDQKKYLDFIRNLSGLQKMRYMFIPASSKMT